MDRKNRFQVRRSEIDRRLEALGFQSGRVRYTEEHILQILRMFNLCDINLAHQKDVDTFVQNQRKGYSEKDL